MKDSDSKIVIAFVVPNLELGGAERQIVQVANGLNRNDFEVHIITLGKDNPLAVQLLPDVNLHIVNKKFKFDVSIPFRLSTLLKRIGANIVHGFLFDAEIYSRIAGYFAGIPLILGSERNSNYQIEAYRKFAKRITNSMMNACIANSESGKNYHQKLFGLADNRYRVVRNGVDIQRFKPITCAEKATIKRSLNLKDKSFVIGMFASFKAQKNHMDFISAAERIHASYPFVEFILVGGELESGVRNTNSYAQSVRERISSSPINDRLTSLGKREDVENIYPCCDITILPSWHEGLPNVALESMACGVPVIASNISDNQFLIKENGIGTVYPVGNVDMLVEEIIKYLTSDNQDQIQLDDSFVSGQEERIALSKLRDNISNQNMINRITEVYRELLTS